MKKFFLNALSSFVGAWIAIVLAGLVAVLVAVAIISNVSVGSAVVVEDKSVLKIDLNGLMTERDDPSSISLASLMTEDLSVPASLETTLTAIKEAKTNEQIKAIYLDCGQIAAAPATLQALRAALADFKTSKKKIYAYADNYSQGAYYVATVANEIVLNPVGGVSFRGMGGKTLFYKSLFDKIGLSFQAVRVGKGKAAIEPYTQDTMSVVARAQTQQMLDTIWLQIRKDIAASRAAITPAQFDTLINRDYVSMKPADYLLKAKIVDKLEYRHAFEERIAKAVGQEKKLEKTVSPVQLAQFAPKHNAAEENQVAVLYACGGIDDVMGASGINSYTLTEQILEMKDDENVKALVLRVNSPGGSAFGSEQIWEALETFKKSGKPFVVSMGDYAASGGYYISCGADRIFANPMCITGSIGIFGLIPNVSGLMDKLGVNDVTVATNPAGQFPNLYDPLDERQLQSMQEMVEDGYELFVKRCADGRHVSADKIKEIADGRPLPALMAKGYGLVDELGGLDDAVKYAAKQAKLKDYNVVSYPEITVSVLQMIRDMQDGSSMTAALIHLFHGGNLSTYAEGARQLLHSIVEADRLRAETVPLKFIL